MGEVRGAFAAAEQFIIASAARDLCGQLVGAETAEGAIQGEAGTDEAIVTEVAGDCERVLRLRHGVQMPAVQLTELLAKLADVQPYVPRQPRPIRIAFLETHLAALEADEDFRV